MKTIESPPSAISQFACFKEKHPDLVILFTMGGYYEAFYEDALVCSELLDLPLRKREREPSHPVPLVGIPLHKGPRAFRTLQAAGYTVAICAQAQASSGVKRDYIRILRPDE